MAQLTLREVCQKYGVSRRAVQGYEACGLVRATGKTERGYLLYDGQAQEKIAQIKKYQDFGFRVREIGTLLDAGPEQAKEMLNGKLVLLKEKRRQLGKLIAELERMIGDRQDGDGRA